MRSAANLQAFLIKQRVLFFFISLMFWACADACACNHTPYMPQPVLVIAGFKCFGNLSEGPKMLLCFATDQQTPQLEKKNENLANCSTFGYFFCKLCSKLL